MFSDVRISYMHLTICTYVPPQRPYPTAGTLKLTGAGFNACARGDERGPSTNEVPAEAHAEIKSLSVLMDYEALRVDWIHNAMQRSAHVHQSASTLRANPYLRPPQGSGRWIKYQVSRTAV